MRVVGLYIIICLSVSFASEANEKTLTPGEGFNTPQVVSEAILGSTVQAIARWNVVPYQRIKGQFNVGVVAFHKDGIEKVVFSVNGGDLIEVDSMTYNERTSTVEYWATLDTSLITSTSIIVRAVAYPKVGMTRPLPDLELIRSSEYDSISKVYVSKKGNDLGFGSRTQPLYSLEEALSRVGTGGVITIIEPGLYSVRSIDRLRTYDWITIRADDSLNKKDVVIGNLPGQEDLLFKYDVNCVRWQNVTIDFGTFLQFYNANIHVWFDQCFLTNSNGWTQSQVRQTVRSDGTAYATSCEMFDNLYGFTGFEYVKDCHARKISGDVFQNSTFIVNSTAEKIDGAVQQHHTDIFQYFGQDFDNVIVYGVKVSDVKDTQLMFFDHYNTTFKNSAFVNVFMDSEYSDNKLSQFYNQHEHMLFYHVSIPNQKILFRETFMNSQDVIFANSILHSVASEIELMPAGVDFINNHFIKGMTTIAGSSHGLVETIKAPESYVVYTGEGVHALMGTGKKLASFSYFNDGSQQYSHPNIGSFAYGILPDINTAPIVEIEFPAVITWPKPAQISYSISDDGAQPFVFLELSQTEGPGVTEILNSKSKKPEVHFSSPGLYTFNLNIKDGLHSIRKTFNILVEEFNQTQSTSISINFDHNIDDQVLPNATTRWHGEAHYESGQYGNAGSFNGKAIVGGNEGNCVILNQTDKLGNLNAFTLSLWFKKRSTSSTGYLFWNHMRFGLNVEKSAMGFHVWTDQGEQRVGVSSVVDDLKWHHVVMRYNGNQLSGFIDGIEVLKDVPLSGRIDPPRNAPVLGGLMWGNSFDGWIDDFNFYRVALQDGHVQELFGVVQEPELLPVLKLNFDRSLENEINNSVTASWIGDSQYTTGVHQQAVQLNGASMFSNGNAIKLNRSPELFDTDRLSLVFWYKKDELDSAGYAFWNHLRYGVTISKEKVGAHLFTDLETHRYTINTPQINDTEWHHIAMTFGDEKLVMYVDGEKISERRVLGKISTSSYHDPLIGAYPWGSSMKASFDELMIFRESLSEAKVSELAKMK